MAALAVTLKEDGTDDGSIITVNWLMSNVPSSLGDRPDDGPSNYP